MALIALAVAAVLLAYWRFRRINALVEQWALPHPFTLLRYEHPWLPPWPPLSLLQAITRFESLVRVRISDEAARHMRHGCGWQRAGGACWIRTPSRCPGGG